MKQMLLMPCLAAVLLTACSSSPQGVAFPAGEIVDLSHTYDSQAIYWPTAEGFQLRRDADGVTPAGYYYASNSFFTSEHGGTHIDAPVHFAEGHLTVDKIPLQQLIGPAVVIDVAQQSEKDADYQVTTDDIQRFEQQHGAIPMDAIVLLRTGFSRRWPGAELYLGTTLRDHVLGMRVAGTAENYGPEQERLNNVFGVRLRITALGGGRGIGVELLGYHPPGF